MSQVQVPVPEGSALSSASSGQRFSCQGPPSVRLEPGRMEFGSLFELHGGSLGEGAGGCTGGWVHANLGGEYRGRNKVNTEATYIPRR